MRSDALKHYGIPGMKWGIRKFIERHDKGKTHRDRIQNKYLERGYSKEEASKRARDTFKDLYKKDPEFRNLVSKVSNIANAETDSTKKQAKAYKALDSLVKGKSKNFHGKAYDGFNGTLAGKGETFDKLRSKYYDALKKQGVDAVIDRNDKALSGYGTKKTGNHAKTNRR